MKRLLSLVSVLALGLPLGCASISNPAESELECSDGTDDDLDGAVDCNDSDCETDPACDNDVDLEICNNAQDDDGDGAFDCNDSDCAGAPNCAEDCNNARDDDGDGDQDCADSDCTGNPVCLPETSCADNLDNDEDGAFDCADSDCAADPVCDPGCDPTNDQCTGNTICVTSGGDCVAAFGRSYKFSNFVLELEATDPNGGTWDNGSGPDPKLEIHINDNKVLETPSQDNKFNVTYSETTTQVINSNTKFEARVLDDDGTFNADDLAISCVADPFPASLLRGRSVICQNSSATLTFNVTPQ